MSAIRTMHRTGRTPRPLHGSASPIAGLADRQGGMGSLCLRLGSLASLLASALCFSACAAGPSGDAVGRYPSSGTVSDAGAQLARLPPSAGRVVAVRRIAYANGFAQEIVLDGPPTMAGENRITISALTTAHTGGRGSTGDTLELGPPRDAEVAAEMARALPGVTMRVAATPERDADGPLGVATGVSGRLACVYAWQYMGQLRPLSLYEGLTDTGTLPTTIRVRLCGERSVAALLTELRGLRLARAGSDTIEPSLSPRGEPALTTAEVPPPRSSSAPPAARPQRSAHRRRAPSTPRVNVRTLVPHRHVAVAPHPRQRGEKDALSTLPTLPMPDEPPGATPAAGRLPDSRSARTVADSALPLPR